VIFGELLAVAAILMCLACVTVADLGRPGAVCTTWLLRLQLSAESVLAWDVDRR
jgi:hypothetical protein